MGDDYVGCPYCGAESLAQEFMGGSCPFCGKANYELEGYGSGYRPPPNYASRRTAAMCETCGENVAQGYDDEIVHLDEHNEPDYETDYGHDPKPVYDQSDEWECADCGKTTIGKECHYCGGTESMDDRIVRAMENRKERSMRDHMSAIEFVASQNVTDREELLFRAHRHASDATCRLPVPVAQRVVQAFVAAVNQEIGKTASCDCGQDEACDDCGAEAGEKCRPWCTGEAAHQDEVAEKKTKKSHRTASRPHEPWCCLYEDHDGSCQGLTDLTEDSSERRPWSSPEEQERARDQLNGEGRYARRRTAAAHVQDFPDELMF